MHRWTSIFGALMLVLFIWTGSTAHAAQRFDCIPIPSQSSGHFEGDRDEAPAKSEKGVAHHHSGCSGHQLGASAEQIAAFMPDQGGVIAAIWKERGAASRSPDAQLRPPIA